MPLYEYLCESCSHRFERIQKFSDPQVSTCPKCSGAVRKLISSPAIQFKGSGFYITDYTKKSGVPEGESKGESKGASSDSKGESKGESKSEPKGESKSESKAESRPESKSSTKAE
ncbi:MAG: hypothetical protein M3R55_13925 [Acidobacteriota bacterium]|nr:hypothetical protein [Acidobacteriota bacterium]